ncbi:GPI12 [Candida pseudojiufengensis]|uniref:GPI12 n=1 Tax=Candida pseudojiufengensis TaxID=497109 RepID=UPI0022246090|nr:GPI12 [Candida pseudojiufengensis]KAI5960581.1 GPI12 [Candida pseudojiufengensis]
MILKLPSFLIKIYILSFITWIILTTSIPQFLQKQKFELSSNSTDVKNLKEYPQNSIIYPKNISTRDSTIYIIIAHPDDEVMFFAPTILELLKLKNNNKLKLICFSKGENIGDIRANELYKSTRILGIDQEAMTILDYKDGMNETWSNDDIVKDLKNLIDLKKKEDNTIIITFDEKGISNHPNHISLHHGTKSFYKQQKSNTNKLKLYNLKSLGFFEKYSFTILTNIEILINYCNLLIQKFIPIININISLFGSNLKNNKNLDNNSIGNSIKFYSDLNMLSCSYAAMAYGHFSQMVWFRYGWLMFSRYLTYNHLIEIS